MDLKTKLEGLNSTCMECASANAQCSGFVGHGDCLRCQQLSQLCVFPNLPERQAVPVLHKTPGRKSTNTSIPHLEAKRRSQRRHRERKEMYTNGLEEKLAETQSSMKSLYDELSSHKQALDAANAKTEALQEELSRQTQTFLGKEEAFTDHRRQSEEESRAWGLLEAAKADNEALQRKIAAAEVEIKNLQEQVHAARAQWDTYSAHIIQKERELIIKEKEILGLRRSQRALSTVGNDRNQLLRLLEQSTHAVTLEQGKVAAIKTERDEFKMANERLLHEVQALQAPKVPEPSAKEVGMTSLPRLDRDHTADPQIAVPRPSMEGVVHPRETFPPRPDRSHTGYLHLAAALSRNNPGLPSDVDISRNIVEQNTIATGRDAFKAGNQPSPLCKTVQAMASPVRAQQLTQEVDNRRAQITRVERTSVRFIVN